MELHHGNCLDIMKTLPDKSVDLFVCDLPYGCLSAKSVQVKHENQTDKMAMAACPWDKKIDLAAFWEQVERLARDDHTPVIHFCTARFGFELYNSKPSWFRYDLIWHKTCPVGFLLANKMPTRGHETIYVFSKKGANYYRKDIEGDFPGQSSGRGRAGGSVYGDVSQGGERHTPTREGIRCATSVMTYSNKKGSGHHPTQKPLDLYAFLIERYSKPGDTVLDPTAGSFNSVFTAHRLGRKAIGIEMDDAFYEKASLRAEA